MREFLSILLLTALVMGLVYVTVQVTVRSLDLVTAEQVRELARPCPTPPATPSLVQWNH